MSDISDMMKNLSGMLDGKQIPDDVQNMLSSLINSKKEDSDSSNNTDSKSSDSPSIDPTTIFKIQNIMSAMNNNQNNPRANLLRSLKPYLKPSRREKVDQYIQLFNMEKVIEMMNINGGDKKDGS